MNEASKQPEGEDVAMLVAAALDQANRVAPKFERMSQERQTSPKSRDRHTLVRAKRRHRVVGFTSAPTLGRALVGDA
jgi:hypothetical protein